MDCAGLRRADLATGGLDDDGSPLPIDFPVCAALALPLGVEVSARVSDAGASCARAIVGSVLEESRVAVSGADAVEEGR